MNEEPFNSQFVKQELWLSGFPILTQDDQFGCSVRLLRHNSVCHWCIFLCPLFTYITEIKSVKTVYSWKKNFYLNKLKQFSICSPSKSPSLLQILQMMLHRNAVIMCQIFTQRTYNTCPFHDPSFKEIRMVKIKIRLDNMKRFDRNMTDYFIPKTIQAELLQTARNQEDLYEFH